MVVYRTPFGPVTLQLRADELIPNPKFRYKSDEPEVYLYFSRPMDTTKTPPLNLFTITWNGVVSTPVDGLWLNSTCFILEPPASSYPVTVLTSFAGPSLLFVAADGTLVDAYTDIPCTKY